MYEANTSWYATWVSDMGPPFIHVEGEQYKVSVFIFLLKYGKLGKIVSFSSMFFASIILEVLKNIQIFNLHSMQMLLSTE